MGANVRNVAVLFADVDYFKAYNDRYGLPSGRRMSQEGGQVHEAAIRNGDILARYGGEEFVVLLDYCGYAESVDTAENSSRCRGDGAGTMEVP